MTECRVFVGGHSFVASIEDHLRHQFGRTQGPATWGDYVTGELKVSSFVEQIHFVGKRGAKVTQDYMLPAQLLNRIKFHIGILDLGSNDVVLRAVTPERIAEHILSEAEAMRDLFGIPVVKICSIVNRENAGQLTAEEFTAKAFRVNELLKEACKHQAGLSYHGHEGFWKNSHGASVDCNAYSYDGIHANSPAGRKKYKASLTKAIHSARRELRAQGYKV